MEKWLILGLGRGKYETNLEQLVALRCKEMFKKKRRGIYPRDTGANQKQFLTAKPGII